MAKAFMQTQWYNVFKEADRMLENSYSEKEVRQIKSLWIPKFREFGFDCVMCKHIDLILQINEYTTLYDTCVSLLDNLDEDFSNIDYNSIKEYEEAYKQNKEEIMQRIKHIQSTRQELSLKINETSSEWQRLAKIYKLAYLCYTPNYFHSETELFALKLAYKDKLKFDNIDQIEMCYYLAKLQQKKIIQKEKQLPTTKYINRKMMNYIIKNQQFINYNKQDKKSFPKLLKDLL